MLLATASFVSIMGTQTSRQAGQEHHDESRPSFPIVGISASAGGVTALVRLLENLPAAPAFLAATMRRREDVIGCGIFDAYPYHPEGAGAAALLRASFEHVLASHESERMPDVRSDIARPDGIFEERWWRPINSPVLDQDGMVEAIIHTADDVTMAHRA